jgi:hypothetical protein
MRASLVALVLLLCLSRPAGAQHLASGSLTTNGQSVSTSLGPSVDGAAVQVTGTWTGTLTFQGSIDGSTFVSVLATSATAGTGGATTNANGIFSFANLGYRTVRVTATAEMTGAAVVTIAQSYAKGGGGGGSGGGDATAANQATEITHLSAIETATEAMETLLGVAGSPIMVISDNSDNEDEHAVCTADCTIYSVTAFNHTAASAFVRCENDTVGNTTPGSETASANELDLEIPASTTGAGFHLSFGVGISYSTALTCWIVSDEAATGTTDVAQNDVRVLWNRVQ